MAADVITRFKLETTQFDSKLRDTAKQLQGIARQAELGGKDFNSFSKDAINAARALGTVASGATNTKDKLKDLVGAYNDAAKAYNKLGDEAKKGEFGKAMSASLQKLQQDIKETKQELYGLGDAVKGKGSLFGEGGLTGMMQVFGGNMLTKGVTMLTSELTGAIEESIQLAKQGEGIRIAFERLNQPGLLDQLKEATHGTVSEIELMQQAIKFDNFKLPLEDLANYLAFAQQKAKDTGESIDYLVNSIVTGLGRQSKQILDNLGISAAELTRRMNEGADMTKAVSDIIKEEMAKAGDYIETAADRAARATADAKNEMEDLGRSALPVAEQFSEAWNTIKIGAMSLLNEVLVPLANSIRDIQNIISGGEVWNIKPKPGIQNLADDPNVDDNGNYKTKPGNSGNMFVWGAVNDISEIVVTGKKPKKKSKTPKTKTTKAETVYAEGSIAAQAKLVSDLTKAWNEATGAMQNGYLHQLVQAEKKLKEMKDQQQAVKDMLTNGPAKGASPVGLAEQLFPTKSIKDLQNLKIDLKLPKEKTKVEDDSSKDISKITSSISRITGGISQMADGMEALGVELPEDMKSAIEGITTLISIVSGIATIVTAIEALTAADTFIPFARGGVVRAAGGVVLGNSYSGDRIPALLNAQEVVLNQAQVGNLASSLRGGGLNNLNLTATFTAEQIRLMLNNNGLRTGRGEYVQTNFH